MRQRDLLLLQSHQLSHQPSSSAPARGLDRLNRLLARVEQMYTMLDSHVQHTADQFAYVQGQITALSSQIDDLFVNQGSDSEFDQFQPFGHFGRKGGENFEGELAQCQGEHRFRLRNIGYKRITFVYFSIYDCFCL